MNNNERELLSLCKTPQVAELMLKAMLCNIAHGEAFTEAIQGCLNSGNIDRMIEIVNREYQALA